MYSLITREEWETLPDEELCALVAKLIAQQESEGKVKESEG